MRRDKERGETQFSGVISLLAIVALAWAAWNIGPLYYEHYDFQDKVNEICRTPKYKANTDEKVIDLVMKEVRERRLDEFIARSNILVRTTDFSRQITITYERTAKPLPGWEKTFEFTIKADQPLV
jgi:hypothetical protein